MDLDTRNTSRLAVLALADSISEKGKSKRIVVLRDGKVEFSDTASVFARVETNYSHIDIFDNSLFEEKYYSVYNNQYQRFTCSKDAVYIDCVDRDNKPILINILF